MTDPVAPARPFRHRLLINTVATGVGNLWTIGLMIVALPLLLSGLGPSAFGAWSLLQTFSTTTGWLSLADLGLGIAGTRFVAEAASVGDEDGVFDLAGTVLALFALVSVIGGVLFAVVGVVAFPWAFSFPDALVADVKIAVVVFGAQCVFDQMTRGMQTCLEGLQRVDLARAAEAVRRTLVLGASAVTAQATGSLPATMKAALLASIVGFALTAALTAHRIQVRRLTFSMPAARRLLRYGRTIAALRPLSVFQRTMDRFIVGIVLGPAAVGVVEIAAQVQNGALAVMSAAGYAVLPGASWLTARGDRGTLRELLTRGSRYTTFATLPAAVLPALLAVPLLSVWIGPEGQTAVVPVVLALTYAAICAPVHVGSELLLGVGRADTVLRAAAIAVTVNLVASVVLVQAIGVAGVYIGTLVSAVAFFPPVVRAFLREVDLSAHDAALSVLRPLVAPTAALVVSAGLVLALDLAPLRTVVLGALLGLSTYVLVGAHTAFGPGVLRGLASGLRRDAVAAT